MFRSLKFLLAVIGLSACNFGAHAQVLRSATDRAAQIHWYQQTLNERAGKEARELAQVLGLNESEMQLVRQFAAARLQTENEAQALIVNDPASRREAQARAAAQFQTRLVNTLNESQMQRYFQLLAETSNPTNGEAPVLAREIAPAVLVPAIAPTASVAEAPAAAAPVAATAPVVRKKRHYVPIGTYHRAKKAKRK